MNFGNILGLVIVSVTSLILIAIGFVEYKTKDNPVGFYNVGDGYKKEEITDVIAWNKKHGYILINYGLTIEVGFIVSSLISSTYIQMIVLLLSILLPLPLMVLRHNYLVKKYYKKEKS